MALSFKTFINRFKKSSLATEVKAVKTPVHPGRDWKIMFVAFSLVSLLIAVGSLYFFLRVEGGEVYSIADGGSAESIAIDRDQLGEVIRKYTQRQNKLEILKKRPTITADPFR
jgi:hypothetical protein